MTKYKPKKKSSLDTDNPILKRLDVFNFASDAYFGKQVYICGNPACQGLIMFHKKGKRPVVCKQCGEEIDWEGEFIRRLKLCPVCNEEYEISDSFCYFHVPKVELKEREMEMR
jgi:hypothetical protein